jgi:homogentisate phytyltransferase / homogentisate geranylgeranyltransferase
VQLGFWAHMLVSTGTTALKVDSRISFMTAFMAFFSVVIALFKDIPDVRGDALHNTKTATVYFGVSRIFWLCIWMLNAAYASAIVYIGVTMSGSARVVALVVQLGLWSLLQYKAAAVDLAVHSDIKNAYMFVWALFYAQYLVFPFLG